MSLIVQITRDARNALLQACMAAPESESCGIAACRRGDPLRIVTSVLPMSNAHPDPASRFDFDPEQWVRIWHSLESSGLDAAGIYHSHPRTPAYPSDVDRSHPLWSLPSTPKPSGSAGGLDLWIVSLMDAGHPEIAAFRPSEAGLRKLMLAEVSI